MKKIHIFIIRSYLGPFVLTFIISLFVLLMQFLWKYLEDLVGKGLEWYVIAEVMLYASASLVPMALPLAILLASIMTFGNLGENYELVAMKSSGMSLPRIMYPLIVLMIFTSGLAFYFSNNILPIANLKFGTLLYDITHQKPTISIPEGIFYNGIENYTLRVSKKENDGELLKNILIYDHTARRGNNKVITAESGTMDISDEENFLVLQLFDGHSYEEQINNDRGKKSPVYIRSSFTEQVVRIDISEFRFNKTDEEMFRDHYQMMNLDQLETALDTLTAELLMKAGSFQSSFAKNFFYFRETAGDSLVTEAGEGPVMYVDSLPQDRMYTILDGASTLARGAKVHVEGQIEESGHRVRYLKRHEIEWHRKFTLSFACLVLFFIGAPLGAIIRKGGLGMPVVMSVIFFLVFHVISITGEKFVKENVMESYAGMWMASIFFLPLGIFLTYKASHDSVIFDAEFYQKILRIFRRRGKSPEEGPEQPQSSSM